MRPQNDSQKPIVVITGSDGLIGSALIRALHQDYDLVGLDNDRESQLDELHELIHCDLTNEASVHKAFAELRRRRGDRIASFIHLAAYYDFSGEDSPMYDKLTIEGTRRILRELQAFQVEQFVFSSTLLVMKPSEDGERIDETSQTQAEWRYPESKLETEQVIETERGGVPAVSLRIGGVYDEWGRAVPLAQQFKFIYEKDIESYFFPGDPDRGQSMVHLEDLVDCFRLLIEKRGELQGFQNFLIGEPEVVAYRELQEVANEMIHGKERSAIPVPKALAKAGATVKSAFSDDEFVKPWMVDVADQEYKIDIDKARTMLGWEPRHKLRDTLPYIAGRLLEDTAKWYEMNGLEAPEEVVAR